MSLQCMRNLAELNLMMYLHCRAGCARFGAVIKGKG
jgi:hypothetical protein